MVSSASIVVESRDVFVQSSNDKLSKNCLEIAIFLLFRIFLDKLIFGLIREYGLALFKVLPIIECDIIPYEEESSNGELHDIYWEYFLHGDENNPRQGIFRYGVLVYWAGIEGHIFRTDAFQVSIKGLEEKKQQFPWLDRDVIYASAYMHELGHTFSFSPIPGHNNDCRAPWQIGWWLVRSYKSCMNYGYMYGLVDYSDGSRGKNDFDDWERMDLQSFQRTWD